MIQKRLSMKVKFIYYKGNGEIEEETITVPFGALKSRIDFEYLLWLKEKTFGNWEYDLEGWDE